MLQAGANEAERRYIDPALQYVRTMPRKPELQNTEHRRARRKYKPLEGRDDHAREDIEAAFSLEQCVIPERTELLPAQSLTYAAFVDPSGGRNQRGRSFINLLLR